MKFLGVCWPDIKLCDFQKAIVDSVIANDETIVPAGNALGKDFISAFIALWFFCSRQPCRVVTHSVDQPQLKGVMWGEIRRFVQTSRFPLPITVGDLICKQRMPDGSIHPTSYLIGRVTRKGEGLLGHHEPTHDKVGCPRTLFIADESSGVDNEAWEVVDTWAHRKLAIGNPYPCTNFFYNGVKKGDRLALDGSRYYTKIIKIKAEDSPNVRLALLEKQRGLPISHRALVPGVKDYATYCKHRETWDPIRQSIGLDAEFWEGSESLLYPPQWLDRAERTAWSLSPTRPGESMGIDAAEGNDNTSWAIVDRKGLIALYSAKTSDTSDIPGMTIHYGRKHSVPAEKWMFDRGGGGKQHADLLRKQGYDVQTIGFGETVSDPQAWSKTSTYTAKTTKRHEGEERYVYKNRRAEMYGLLRLALDPDVLDTVFALPTLIVNKKRPDGGASLREQMAKIPTLYDPEGRMYLPPKNRPAEERNKQTEKKYLREMLGCSPDELDALVLAVFGLTFKPPVTVRSMM